MTTIDSSEIRARLEYVETHLFGAPLPEILSRVTQPEPPAPEPRQHTCVPAIVEPDVSGTAARTADLLAPIIRQAEDNLQMLRTLEQTMRELHDSPTALNDDAALRPSLHEAYEALDAIYASCGDEAGVAVLKSLGALSGDRVSFTDGNSAMTEFSLLDVYALPATSVEDLIRNNACEGCVPNIEELVQRDTAAGRWPRKKEAE